MTGVASTGTSPLPMLGALCSTATLSSADPIKPGLTFERSIAIAGLGREAQPKPSGGRAAKRLLGAHGHFRRNRRSACIAKVRAEDTDGLRGLVNAACQSALS
jgi:hypothetical protein